jgi:hypothetical protein
MADLIPLSLNVDGYVITVYRSQANHIGVVRPDGSKVSCLYQGTHRALDALPPNVRTAAEQLAGWRNNPFLYVPPRTTV